MQTNFDQSRFNSSIEQADPKMNSVLEISRSDAVPGLHPKTIAETYLKEVLTHVAPVPLAENRSPIDVFNPADGKLIGQINAMGEENVGAAVRAANIALADWRCLLPRERGSYLQKWCELIVQNSENLACLMTLEQGKPLDDARGEIAYAASFFKWFAEEVNRLYGEVIPAHLPDKTMLVKQQPIGIVAAITPWNFPSAMLARKASAALAAGCTVIAVPSKVTPYSALALQHLAEQAGLPSGVFTVLTGHSRELVAALCKHTAVRAVSYTGSTEVGRNIMAQCADTVKRVSLELGGHAPFIIYADAELDKTVEGAIAAKFQTGGQDCLAANRIYVHRSIHDRFLTQFVNATRALVVGDGFEKGTAIGPLATLDTLKKSQAHVADAMEKGARLLCGGTQPAAGGLFYQPTVLADVTHQMKIAVEETFGPVAAIIPFDDDDDVLSWANDTEYGLVAYAYTTCARRIQVLPDQLEYGMVAINTAKLTGAPIPFGGMKQSGIGREGSRLGILEFTEPQYACIQR